MSSCLLYCGLCLLVMVQSVCTVEPVYKDRPGVHNKLSLCRDDLDVEVVFM